MIERTVVCPAERTRPDGASPPAELARQRKRMRRFTESYARLPVPFEATCPGCGRRKPARFERAGRQVVLRWDCDACNAPAEVHDDAIWTRPAPDPPDSPASTLHGARIHPISRRLPRTVESLCPECGAIILGRYFVEDQKVWIEKTCPEHGYVRDIVNSDPVLFAKGSWWSFEDAPGQQFPQVQGHTACPSDCGLCDQHLSSPCLAQIDLTNRCNMACPICFANAGAAGYVAEPDYEQVIRQLKVLRDLRPTPCTAIEFTGGEPTLHPDFLRIVSTAREMGFSHIQIASNGLTLADESFARRAADAGLHVVYLQFDGVGEDAYRQTRDFAGIWDKKLSAVENCRQADIKVCLVPTIVKGVNDDQVGAIIDFAARNIDVVSAISFQPVSFTGRISTADRLAMRYTLGDLAHDIADGTGASALRDMYPLSIVAPLSQFLQAVTGQTKIQPSCHTECAFGTYFLVAPDGSLHPFPEVIDVEGMFSDMNRLARRIGRRGRMSWLDRWRILRMFRRNFREDRAPAGLDVRTFMRSLQGLVDKNVGRGDGEKHTYKTLLCAGMHFQDRYNFDVERVKRCVILYSTPGGVFPFCTYNCGPEYRPVVEKTIARRADEDQ
jgi:hypothetical protein